jgi:hypothetical protein
MTDFIGLRPLFDVVHVAASEKGARRHVTIIMPHHDMPRVVSGMIGFHHDEDSSFVFRVSGPLQLCLLNWSHHFQRFPQMSNVRAFTVQRSTRNNNHTLRTRVPMHLLRISAPQEGHNRIPHSPPLPC